MYSLIEDIAKITTIPVTSLQKLANKANFCICNCVEETKLNSKSLTEINIGIGILSVNVVDNNIEYRFTPNKKFEESIRTTLIEGKNPLIELADDTLVSKLLHTYKDIL